MSLLLFFLPEPGRRSPNLDIENPRLSWISLPGDLVGNVWSLEGAGLGVGKSRVSTRLLSRSLAHWCSPAGIGGGDVPRVGEDRGGWD